MASSARSVGDGSAALESFRSALYDADFADVTFVVQGKRLEAHRCILAARSPVFKAMLFGVCRESREREVPIDDFDPSHFEPMLEWAYTGTARISARDVLGVLRVAMFYDFEELVRECRQLASEYIDVANVPDLLDTAVTLGEEGIAEQCLDFWAGDTGGIVRQPAWLSVGLQSVLRIVSMEASDCPECTLFRRVVDWVDHNYNRVEVPRDDDDADASSHSDDAASNDNDTKADEEGKADVADVESEGQAGTAADSAAASQGGSPKSRSRAASPVTADGAPATKTVELTPDGRRKLLLKLLLSRIRFAQMQVDDLLRLVRPVVQRYGVHYDRYVQALEFKLQPVFFKHRTKAMLPRAPPLLGTAASVDSLDLLASWTKHMYVPGMNLPHDAFAAIPQDAVFMCIGVEFVGGAPVAQESSSRSHRSAREEAAVAAAASTGTSAIVAFALVADVLERVAEGQAQRENAARDSHRDGGSSASGGMRGSGSGHSGGFERTASFDGQYFAAATSTLRRSSMVTPSAPPPAVAAAAPPSRLTWAYERNLFGFVQASDGAAGVRRFGQQSGGAQSAPAAAQAAPSGPLFHHHNLKPPSAQRCVWTMVSHNYTKEHVEAAMEQGAAQPRGSYTAGSTFSFIYFR